MQIELVARPAFLGSPFHMGVPRADQMQGPAGQKLVELAGRTCYDSLGKGRGSAEYAVHIMESGHGSVLEHAQYTFFIGGVSRGLTHELVRHRVGVAISQRSTRYVDESESPWIKHPLLAQYGELTNDAILDEAWDAAQRTCQATYDLIAGKLEAHLIDRGTDKATARKQARGAARGILGNALETELIWSANVRALQHVITLRAHPAADAEIRALGCALLRIMQSELPVYFKHFEIESSPDGIGEIAVAETPSKAAAK